jgi:hypothetical protein
MRLSLFPSLAAAAFVLALAACGGGGNGGPSGTLPAPVASPAGSMHNVSVSIRLPSPAPASARVHRNYISPATVSIGVAVAISSASPGPSTFVNVSTCPSTAGVVTCSLTIPAFVGPDVFTATGYSAANGGGSVLSSGSVNVDVSPSLTTPVALTMGGTIATLTLAPDASMPFGQFHDLHLSAKDATGATIVGPFDNPVVVSASNIVFFPGPTTASPAPTPGTTVSFPDSNSAGNAIMAWAAGYSSSTSATITAKADGQSASASVAPATGFAIYESPTIAGTSMQAAVLGPDGAIYYTSTSSFDGAIGAFNPATQTGSAQDMKQPVYDPYFTGDGALWMDENTPISVLRFAAPSASGLASATYQTIPLPTPPGHVPFVFGFAQDTSGNLWMAAQSSGDILSIPVAGPYTTAAIAAYPMPSGPPGTPQLKANLESIALGSDGMLYVGDLQGVVDQVNPATGVALTQTLVPQESTIQSLYGPTASAKSDQMAATTSGMPFIVSAGTCSSPCNSPNLDGFLDAITPGGTPSITNVALPGNIHDIFRPTASATSVYFIDNNGYAVGSFNPTTGSLREIPMNINDVAAPEIVVEAHDGSIWFGCNGASVVLDGNFCMAHAIYLSGWSIFPNTSIQLGSNAQAGVQFGIMEPPTTNSGPFTVTSSNTSVCTITGPQDHNFQIVPAGPGTCTVTVTDAHSVSQTITATSTTVTGVIQSRGRTRGSQPSGGRS